MKASDKRVLISGWSGQAYRTMMTEDFNSFRYRLFQKTGCLVTADSSDDNKVQPGDLKDNQVTLLAIIGPSSTNPVTITVENASSENTNDEIDEATEFEEEKNIIVVGTESEDTTQNNDGEDGWVHNYLEHLDNDTVFLVYNTQSL